MPHSPFVQIRRDRRAGCILLDRPKALNALDLGMIEAIAGALEAWQDDPSVHVVVIEGAGGRAFCAGGDIRLIREASMARDSAAIESFFVAEYALNLRIATYPKPFVAVVDGICMGGGVGVSVHGAYRVATERAVFAMPETGIGLFPDIGATYLLPRLRGVVGMYMALTGGRVAGGDAAWAGLATHVVPSAQIAALVEAIAADGVCALAMAADPVAPGRLASQALAIERCFGASSVLEIVARLEADSTEWARETLATLRAMSPSAVLWTFELIRQGAGRTLPQCLAAELAFTRHATRHPDFLEGVRAMVVDKDRAPRWSPPRLEDVDTAAIAAALSPP